MLATAFSFLLIPTTWIVDVANGPGTHFTSLPPAIAAAQNGDTILVQPGYYVSGIVTSGKALTIRGAGAGVTRINGATIGSVPAGASLLLAGIEFTRGVDIDGAGRVVLLDCIAQDAWASSAPTSGIRIAGGASVHASRCLFVGGALSPMSWSAGGHGAWLVNGQLAATQCELRGGDPQTVYTSWPLTFAGSGVVVDNGELSLSGSVCSGGRVTWGFPNNSGIGGDGVRVNQGVARITGPGSVKGGAGHQSFNITAATSGVGVRHVGGAVTVHADVTLLPAFPGAPLVSGSVASSAVVMPRLLSQVAVLASGEVDGTQPLTMTFSSQLPGAPFAFVVGFEPGFAHPFGSLLLGATLVDLTAAGLVMGSLDPTGEFSFSLVPSAVFGIGFGIPLFAQAAAFDQGGGQFRLSNVDERFYAL